MASLERTSISVNPWRLGAVLLLCVGTVAIRSDATPQAQLGNLSGLIVDIGNARVPGAQIIVEGNGLRRATKSAGDGTYNLQLPEGKYRLSVTQGGFYPFRKKTVTVRANVPVTLNVTLKGIRNDSLHS